MEASKYRPNDSNEAPGGTAKTPGLPWRIAACSILPVLPPLQVKGNYSSLHERPHFSFLMLPLGIMSTLFT
jgi:hypothetical protein